MVLLMLPALSGLVSSPLAPHSGRAAVQRVRTPSCVDLGSLDQTTLVGGGAAVLALGAAAFGMSKNAPSSPQA